MDAEIEIMQCPVCLVCIESGCGACPECGHVFAPDEIASGAEERELLEWAAKAVGYMGRVEFSGLTDECFFAFGMSEQNPRERSTWRPNTDIGDATHLAEMLNLNSYTREVGGNYAGVAFWPACRGDLKFFEFSGDEKRDTCLAVLRTAAAIGKAMS